MSVSKRQDTRIRNFLTSLTVGHNMSTEMSSRQDKRIGSFMASLTVGRNMCREMRAEEGEGLIPDAEFKPGFVRRMMGLVLCSATFQHATSFH